MTTDFIETSCTDFCFVGRLLGLVCLQLMALKMWSSFSSVTSKSWGECAKDV